MTWMFRIKYFHTQHTDKIFQGPERLKDILEGQARSPSQGNDFAIPPRCPGLSFGFTSFGKEKGHIRWPTLKQMGVEV